MHVLKVQIWSLLLHLGFEAPWNSSGSRVCGRKINVFHMSELHELPLKLRIWSLKVRIRSCKSKFGPLGSPNSTPSQIPQIMGLILKFQVWLWTDRWIDTVLFFSIHGTAGRAFFLGPTSKKKDPLVMFLLRYRYNRYNSYCGTDIDIYDDQNTFGTEIWSKVYCSFKRHPNKQLW